MRRRARRRKEPPSHLRAQWPEGEGPYLRGRDEQPAARLQQDGSIEKLGSKTYIITKRCRAFLRRVLRAAPVLEDRPHTALDQEADLRRQPKERSGEPRFTETDLTTLWQRCGGRCAITRLEFTDEKVGTGRAERAFAPSSTKSTPRVLIRSRTVDSSWSLLTLLSIPGEEVYLRLSRAAVRAADEGR